MKHLVISNYDDIKNPFYGGGGARVIHEVAKRLSHEYKITIITGKYKNSRNEVVDGIHYKRIGTSLFGPQMGQLFFYFSLFLYFFLENFDVWTENFTPPFSTNFLQVFTKKPVIGLVHMLIGEDMKRKYKIPFDVVENIGIKKYKNFIVTTDTVKKKILQLNPEADVAVVPNGIDPITTAPDKIKQRNNIIFLGRIEVNQKGLDLLLKAIAMLPSTFGHKLLIAGNGTTQEIRKLKAMIMRLHLSEKVEFIGRVEGMQKIDLFNSALCTIVPSRFETFSMVTLESIAAGVAVVAFDIEGLSWIPNDIISKVPPFDVRKLSEAIQDIINNAVLREQRSMLGKEFTKTLTWKRTSEEYKRFINKVLEAAYAK